MLGIHSTPARYGDGEEVALTALSTNGPFNFEDSHGTKWSGFDLFFVGLPSFVNAKPSPFEWWPWALAGFLTAAALTILSQRFVWWPLHPVGVYIATSQPL